MTKTNKCIYCGMKKSLYQEGDKDTGMPLQNRKLCRDCSEVYGIRIYNKYYKRRYVE